MKLMLGTAFRIIGYRRLIHAIEQSQAVFIAGFCAGGIAVALVAMLLSGYLCRKG